MSTTREKIASELLEELDIHGPWSLETFGRGQRTEGILKHIAKELDEIREDPKDLFEWADVIILAIDGARRTGCSVDDILKTVTSKMATNRTRWYPKPVSENEPVEHDRSGEAPSSGPPAGLSVRMALTDVELATILAALRCWQDNVNQLETNTPFYEEDFENLEPLSSRQIDDLCERLNVGRV